MRDLPERLPMKRQLLGDGRNGSSVQLLANDEFDVLCFVLRADRYVEFTEQWTSAATGPLVFPTWGLLRRAMLDDYVDSDLMSDGEWRKHLFGYSIVMQVSAAWTGETS